MDFRRWPPEAVEEYHERMAIMTIDGCLTEEEAEEAALECVSRRHAVQRDLFGRAELAQRIR